MCENVQSHSSKVKFANAPPSGLTTWVNAPRLPGGDGHRWNWLLHGCVCFLLKQIKRRLWQRARYENYSLGKKISPFHLSIEFENKCVWSIENGRICFMLKQVKPRFWQSVPYENYSLAKNLTLSLVNKFENKCVWSIENGRIYFL